jgi:hypothetical protein
VRKLRRGIKIKMREKGIKKMQRRTRLIKHEKEKNTRKEFRSEGIKPAIRKSHTHASLL